MRGDNAGDTSNQLIAVTLPPNYGAAAHMRACVKCGTPFLTDYEEPHCGNCVAWSELRQTFAGLR